MKHLYEWTQRWNITGAAIDDLLRVFGLVPSAETVQRGNGSEIDVQNSVKLEAVRKGMRLWRNNVGVLRNAQGGYVRYGLANESSAINEVIKSADLIGIKPVMITQELVGRKIGQFVSREIKAHGWRFSGSQHEMAQMKWVELITSYGGDAGFATGEGSL